MLASVHQRVTHTRVQSDFVVDRFAGSRESLLLLAFRLSEQAPDHPIMHVKDLIDNRGFQIEHECHQHGMAAHRLQVSQVLRTHVCALARKFREAALVNQKAKTLWQLHGANAVQPVEVR